MTAKIIPIRPRPKIVTSNFEPLFQVSIRNVRAVVRSTYMDFPTVAVAAGEDAAIVAINEGKTFTQAMNEAGDEVRRMTSKCLSNVMKVKK